MQSTTPSGARRIWARTPSFAENRAPARSVSLRASMVSAMYWTVRSNSFSLSARLLPISHMSSRTVSSRTVLIRAANASSASALSPTRMVGQRPRPWSHACWAEESAPRAASLSSRAAGPSGRWAAPPAPSRMQTADRVSAVRPDQVRTSPPTRYWVPFSERGTSASAGMPSRSGKRSSILFLMSSAMSPEYGSLLQAVHLLPQ